MDKKLRRLARTILGRNLTEEEEQRIININQDAEVDDNDAFALGFFMQEINRIHFEENYGDLPTVINDLVKKSADSAAIQSTAQINNAIAGLVPAVESAVSSAASKAARKTITNIRWGNTVFTLSIATFIVGAAFAFGCFFSSPTWYLIMQKKWSLPEILSRQGWGIAVAFVTPLLFVLAHISFDERENTRGYWLSTLGSLLVLLLLFQTFLGIKAMV
jgi:hypothetical protein